jgi:Domain of unknown function (DUF4214)
MASTTYLQQAYLAYFGRPADVYGLSYYANKTEAQVIAAFSASPESQSFFGASDTLTQINTIYQNLFNRPAEPAGLLYWAGEINSGRLSLAQASMGILNGAQNNDKIAVTNKLAASVAFTASLDTTDEMIGYQGSAVITSARAFLASVGSDAASLTAATSKSALDATVHNVVTAGSAASSSVAGSIFTLTSDVNAVLGGANNDTISGLIGASGTYTVGDSIIGGAGTDTLNLIDAGSATSAPLVSLQGVETVNVRMLTAGTTVVNANDWSGVATITNASSFAGSTLTVTGAEVSSNIKVYGDSDVNVAFRNSTTAGSVSTTLVSVGTGNTATTIASASAAATANFDLDLNNSGLIASVNIEVQGSVNLARMEAGSNVTAYIVTGSGNASLITDDLLSTFDASAAQGNLDITFEGASTIAVKGGAGNDTINFATGAYVSTDTIVGGAGTDTLSVRVGAFNRTVTTSQVEKVTLQYNENGGGSISMSGSDATTINLQPSAAGAAISVTDVISGATVNMQRAATASIDFQSGTTTSTINVGSAGTGFSADALTITDGGAITINSIGGSAAKANGVSALSLDANAKSLAINTSGTEADLTVNAIAIGGISALTITTQGSAGFTLSTGMSGTLLASVTVNAAGNNAGDVTLAAIQDSTGLNTVTLNASSGADVYGASFEFGNGSQTTTAAPTITFNAGNGSEIGAATGVGTAGDTGIVIATTGWATLNVNANASASGSIHIGTITMASGAGTATGGTDILNVSATIDVAAVVRTEAINLSGGWTGQQVNLSNVSVGQSGTFVFASGGINLGSIENSKVTIGTVGVGTAAAVTVGGISGDGASGKDLITLGTVTLSQSGTYTLGNIQVTSGAVGAINAVVNGGGATATFGTVTASAVGAVTVTLANGSSDVHFGAIGASASLGNVQINVGTSGSAVFSTLAASAIGSISVSGAGFASIGTITANKVGTVSQTGSGTFSIDLSGVSAGVEVNLGLGTANSVISGKGNDVITLLAGQTGKSGNDTIAYKVTGQGTDNIINFIAGARASGGDVIAINSSGFSVISALTADAAADFITVSGTATMTAADNIIVLVSAFASTAAMLTAVGSGGTDQITLAATAATGQGLVIVWGDGTDSYVSLLSLNGTGASAVTLSTTGAHTIETFAVISGVSAGAFVAANFDFV